MKRIFAALPTVIVASGIAGWAVARADFTDRVEERARSETQAGRMDSQRVARSLLDQLARADRVVISRRPENGGYLDSVQDRAWISQLTQLIGRAEFTTQRTWSLWVSDTALTCYRGTEKVLWLMPLGRAWKISAQGLSGEVIVSDADGAAMAALFREAQPRLTSS